MKHGDLVRPLLTCAGQPGHRRCNASLVIGGRSAYQDTEDETSLIKIFCNCGTSVWVPEDTLELISESR